MSYIDFIRHKNIRAKAVGIVPKRPISKLLFRFQADTVTKLLQVGRGAAFLDTGMGKTIVELEFSQHCIEETGMPGLILAPLAITQQILQEAKRFGYDAVVVRDASEVRAGIINICNYDMIHRLIFSDFGSIVLDESSILKNFSGATAQALVQAASGIRFRLCATATPAPNDYTELGMHAEFLGLLSVNEMLARWFTNDRGETSKWRLKKHGIRPFWNWVASWAVMAEKPSDLGYSDTGYDLLPLDIRSHTTPGAGIIDVPGQYGFFSVASATNMHGIKRQTIEERAKLVNGIVRAEPDEAWAIWCDTDYEADALKALLPEAIELRGSHSPAQKEDALVGFASGKYKWIITKPKIAGFGLNWQHCARTVFVGRTFSYEAWYQTIRRFWRFGQLRIVIAHLIFAEGDDQIDAIIGAKSHKHVTMKTEMREASKLALKGVIEVPQVYEHSEKGEVPAWL